MVRSIGKTQLRVMLALLVTSLVPLVAAMSLADSLVTRMSDVAYNPELGAYLDRSLGLYADLVKSMKQAMRSEGEAIAAGDALRQAAAGDDPEALPRELGRIVETRPGLLSLAVEDVEGDVIAERRRDQPLDETRERPFTVRRPLAEGDESPVLKITFAADRSRLEEMAGAQELVQIWQALASKQRAQKQGGGPIPRLVDRATLTYYGMLFVLTVLLAVISALFVVRPLIRRINELAAATRPVAEGDLSVRVDAQGSDEIADLGRAFNHMLETLDASRARIEFLKRVGEWQNMARRLAHEIKNPLTPIQLAVQECRQQYDGDDTGYRELLDTTHDIVVEEVASLRKLVGEFSEFARLPRATLQEGDLGDYLREQEARLLLDSAGAQEEERAQAEPGQAEAELSLEIDDGPMPVALDHTMLYRVLANLVANAVQAAVRGSGAAVVRVGVRSRGQHCELEVEDSGPGIPEGERQRIFDPYVTTRKAGTGLGLTIVKKVVIDHGGSIAVGDSSLGGARFVVRLPRFGTAASLAAVTQSEGAPLSG